MLMLIGASSEVCAILVAWDGVEAICRGNSLHLSRDGQQTLRIR